MDIKIIIEKLISNIGDGKMGAGDLLRNAKILAFNIDNVDFKKWIDKECNGYSENEELPPYRVIKTVLYGKIEQIKGLGSSLIYDKFLLPTSHLPSEQQDIINTWRCINPIGEIQSIIDNAGDNDLASPCPISVIPLVKKALYPNVNVNQVWREIQKYDLENVIESVKNRLLDFLLKLDKEMKLDTNFAPTGDNGKIQKILNSTIYAGIANFGNNNHTEVKDSNISINEQVNDDLFHKIADIVSKIEENEQSCNKDIKDVLTEIKEELNGQRKKSKLKLFFQALLGVATEISANLITPYAQQALGLIK